MSELKSNKISPALGTTVTLGDSGDTIAIPSGVTVTGLPAHTGNVAFPATQVASSDANTLDDYEEGTFNVTCASNTGTLTIHSSWDTFAYIKIGRMVHINGEIAFGSASNPSGSFFIYGLPFSCTSLPEGAETCVISALTYGAVSNFEGLRFYTVAGSTTLFGRHDGRTNDGSNCANFLNTNTGIRLTGTYITDN